MGTVDFKSVRAKVTDAFVSFTTKKVKKLTISLTAMISAWSITLAVEHAVSNIWVRLLIVLDIGGTIIKRFRYRWNNYKTEARKAENGDMENVKQKFLHSHFLKDDQKFFWKMLRLDWLIRHKVLTPLSENITAWEHLRLCTQMV